MVLNLTKRLIGAFENYKGYLPRLEIVDNGLLEVDPHLAKCFEENMFPSYYDQATGIDDIIIKRSTLIACFSECYKYLYQVPNPSKDDLYFATLGILLVSAEDHTALNLNWEILQNSPEKMHSTFKVITLYLTCSISKTNKSASLWLYYRKLLIRFISEDPKCQKNLIKQILDVIILSIKIHKRSYYAGYTLRFMIALLRMTNNNDLIQYYLNKIFHYVRTDGLNDMSMWQIWAQLLLEFDDEKYYRLSIIKLGYPSTSHVYKLSPITVLNCYHQLMEWLLSLGYKFYPGWFVAALLARDTGNATKMKNYLETEIANFEKIGNSRAYVKQFTFSDSQHRKDDNTDIIKEELSDKYMTLKKLYYTFYISDALYKE